MFDNKVNRSILLVDVSLATFVWTNIPA